MAHNYSFGQEHNFGSLTYSLDDPFFHETDLPQDAKEEYSPTAESETNRRSKVRPKRTALLVVVGYVCAAALLTASLLARIEVMEASDSITELQNELDRLEEERSKLTIEYESAFDLNELESYATEVLGMRMPGREQVRYVNSSANDKEQTADLRNVRGFGLWISDFFGSLGAYFG